MECVSLPELNHDLAGVADSIALGGDVGMIGQREVSALVGRHRLQRNGSSGIGDTTGHSMSHVGQRLVAPILVAFHVNHYIDALAGLMAHDVLDHELNRIESLALPSYQETGVVALNLENRAIQGLVVQLLERKGGVHVHHRKQRLKDFRGDGYAVGRIIIEKRNADNCGFCAYTEDTRLPPANDGDFYVAAFGV